MKEWCFGFLEYVVFSFYSYVDVIYVFIYSKMIIIFYFEIGVV